MSVAATAYYPYDSGAGANVTEAQWRAFMAGLSPSAVLAGVNNELAPSGDSSGMQVKVATGAAWVRGAYGEWTSGVTTLPIAAVGGIPGGQSRIDSIVCRNDMVNNQMVLDVLTGTAGASPSAPALTQSSSVWEILLGNVTGLTNATSTITAAMVTEGRWKMTPSGILYHEQSPTSGSVTLPAAGSFPSGYRDLVLRVFGRTDKAAQANEVINLRFNGDSSAGSHTWSNLAATTATPAAATPTNTTFASAGQLPAATATANLPGQFWIEVPEYLSTTFLKTFLSRMGFQSGGSGFELGLFQGNWVNATALSSIVLFTANSGNFVAGSRVIVEARP